MNTARGGGEPMPPQAVKNTEMSGNISDVFDKKLYAGVPARRNHREGRR